MISIICVYSNKNIFEKYLSKSLQEQNAKYELIAIDNTAGIYKSAAQAYNSWASRARGKYFMFVHQDVDLYSVSWLYDVEIILDSIGNFGIVGVAGMSEMGQRQEDRGRNIIFNHEDHSPWKFGHRIEKPEQVQTLDGCLLIIPSSVFDLLKFDERVCNDWHLYDVDYCLSCQEIGLGVYVLPVSIYHRSAGSWHNWSRVKILFSWGGLPEKYYITLSKLINKHKPYYRHIYAGTGDWNTYQPVFAQRTIPLIKNGFKYAIKYIRNVFTK
jgi:hypothetical protein